MDEDNRYRIMMKRPEGSDRNHNHDMMSDNSYAALEWVLGMQFKQGSFTPEQRRYLIGKQYESEKGSHGGSRKIGTSAGEKTCDRIAREYNTSKNTVIRAEAFAKAVDAADKIEPGIRRQILSGEIRITEKEIQQIINAKPKEREELVKLLHLPKEKRQSKINGEASAPKDNKREKE